MTTEITEHPVIAMDAVESSQISAIGHCPVTNTLAIQFPSKSGAGSVYHYANFEVEAFEAFKNAASLGSHFIKNIKPHRDRYPYVKVS